VEKSIPRDDKFAKGSLWVQMVEKAYVASGLHYDIGEQAGFKPRYEDISGGISSEFVYAITGIEKRNIHKTEKIEGHTYAGAFLNDLLQRYTEKHATMDGEMYEDMFARYVLGIKEHKGMTKLQKEAEAATNAELDTAEVQAELRTAADAELRKELDTELKTEAVDAELKDELDAELKTELDAELTAEMAEGKLSQEEYDEQFKKRHDERFKKRHAERFKKRYDERFKDGLDAEDEEFKKRYEEQFKKRYEERFKRNVDKQRREQFQERFAARYDGPMRASMITTQKLNAVNKLMDSIHTRVDAETTVTDARGAQKKKAYYTDALRQDELYSAIEETDFVTPLYAEMSTTGQKLFDDGEPEKIKQRLLERIHKSSRLPVVYQAFYREYSPAAQSTYDEIKEAIERGDMVTGGTMEYKPPEVEGAEGLNNEHIDNGIVESHAYTVLGVEEREGVLLVKLRNPWGTGTVGYSEDSEQRGGIARKLVREENEGFFLMELNDFVAAFNKVDIN
jgi:hypothetical protein